MGASHRCPGLAGVAATIPTTHRGLMPSIPLSRPILTRMLVAALTLSLALLLFWMYRSVTGAAADLAVVRTRLEQAVDEAESGELSNSAATFRQAEVAAERALSHVHSPPVRLLGFLPRFDTTVRSLVATTEAAHLIAEAGRTLSLAMAATPGGLDVLALGDDEYDGEWLEEAQALEEPVLAAQARIALALQMVLQAPSETTSTQVDSARRVLTDRLVELAPVLDSVAALVGILPDLFGDDEERRYFLGAQNPAEMRGTGGLIGAYSIMTVRDGTVALSAFRPVQTLPTGLFTRDVAPSDDFFERYASEITGPGSWLNINFSPDFPAVAETIERTYRAATGEHLHGTILVDPFALEHMLRATGPVQVPDPDVETLAAETVVEYITRDAPLLLGFGGERKEILGEAARAVMEEFLSGNVPGRRRLVAFGQAISGGHVMMHSTSPQVQDALAQIGIAGQLPDPMGLILHLSLNNTAESKADTWLTHSIDWNVSLDPDGTATARLRLSLSNTAPADPTIPRYIMGPGPENTDNLAFGESRPLLAVACGTCTLHASSYPDDDQFGVRHWVEAGHNLYSTRPRIRIGESVTIEQVFEVPDAWRRAGDVGIVEFTIDTPPTITPIPVTVSIEPPSGWSWETSNTGSVIAGESELSLTTLSPNATYGPFALNTLIEP